MKGNVGISKLKKKHRNKIGMVPLQPPLPHNNPTQVIKNKSILPPIYTYSTILCIPRNFMLFIVYIILCYNVRENTLTVNQLKKKKTFNRNFGSKFE